MVAESTTTCTRRRWFYNAILALIVLGLVWGFVVPLLDIHFRLSRNEPIANKLVEMLGARYPGTTFRGGASYMRDEIAIWVVGRLDDLSRKDVEEWLREQKIEQNIKAEIWFRPDLDSEEQIKM
jgi:hypothetical protein